MKKKITYTKEPLGKLRVVRDFLPSPEKLTFKEERAAVTMRSENRTSPSSRTPRGRIARPI
jgi:hypothetical protein